MLALNATAKRPSILQRAPFVNTEVSPLEDTKLETATILVTFNLNSIGDNLPILQLHEKSEYKKM